MKKFFLKHRATARISALFLASAACAGLLSSCVTLPEDQTVAGVYKFSVIQYKEPVEAKSWSIDPAQFSNPEGAALNIISAMQKGDVDFWLASWNNEERPAETKEQRESLVQKWQPLKDGEVSVLGRVVAGADLVVELSVVGPQLKATKVQLPMKHAAGRWWLTNVDPGSEFLNWETSPNKIMGQIDSDSLRNYLQSVQATRLQTASQ